MPDFLGKHKTCPYKTGLMIELAAGVVFEDFKLLLVIGDGGIVAAAVGNLNGLLQVGNGRFKLL